MSLVEPEPPETETEADNSPSPEVPLSFRLPAPAFTLPCLVVLVLLIGWEAAVRASGSDIFPGPWPVALGIVDLIRKGLLPRYIVASLFRVTWGFSLAAIVGVPVGLFLGWFRPAYRAFNPLIQVLRPISPIAWIPLAILWFGVSDLAPVFLIFLASVFPIAVSATAAVQNLQPVYLRAARNFGLGRLQLFRRVILPATLPQILTGVRIALGVRVAGGGRGRDDRGQLGARLPDHRRPQRRQAVRPSWWPGCS